MVVDMLAGTFNNWLNDSRYELPERLRRAMRFLQEALRTPT